LGLQPLPREGGYYRETYRSPLTLSVDALAPRYLGAKAACTAIYLLIFRTVV
jgi:predicted cupin superfamily sugar epimerase